MVLRLSSFAADVRGVILTGFSLASSAAVTATDTVLAGLGKLQAQVNGLATITATGGTTARPLAAKLGDRLTVRDFGALGDGVTDDVLAFEAAAANALDVYVPKGNYYLSRPVNPQGRDISYHMAMDATTVGNAQTYLNGGLFRVNRFNRQTFGTFNQGAILSVNGSPLDAPAGVEGFTTPSQQASYGTRDGVALYVENTGPPAVFSSSGTTTYSATGVSNTAASNPALTRIGMFVITRHSPFYSGEITAFSADGLSFTVSGWFQQGNTASGQVPSNNVAFDVCAASAVWAGNFNVILQANSFQTTGQTATGLEIGLFQDNAAFNPTTQLPNVTGLDVVELGTYGSAVAYLHRGQTYNAFASSGARQNAFYVYDNTSGANGPYAAPNAAFRCDALTSPFVYVPKGVPTWLVASNGQMDIGDTNVGGTVGIDFHVLPDNPSAPRDYDVRLAAFNNGAGGSDLQVTGATFLHVPALIPNATNAYNLGSPSFAWGNMWLNNLNLLGGLAATSNISTSAGTLNAGAGCKVGTGASGGGYFCKAGLTGGFGTNQYNLYWTGSAMQLWVDTSNIGNITVTSDERYKQAIEPLADDALSRVLSLRPVSYRWQDKGIFRDDGAVREGLLAQQVRALIPSAVEGDPDKGDEMLSLNVLPLMSVLIKAMQEMAEQLSEVRAEVAALRPA